MKFLILIPLRGLVYNLTNGCMNNVIDLIASQYAELRPHWEKIKILDDCNQRKNFMWKTHEQIINVYE